MMKIGDVFPDSLRLLGQIFCALEDDEIETSLLPVVYTMTYLRLGVPHAQKIFRRLGSPKYAINDAAINLILDYLLNGQRNKSAYLRERVACNKTLPPSEPHGAGGTDVVRLRRFLDRALETHRSYLASPFIAPLVGNPDFAEDMKKRAGFAETETAGLILKDLGAVGQNPKKKS
jgi:hypothetical protein